MDHQIIVNIISLMYPSLALFDEMAKSLTSKRTSTPIERLPIDIYIQTTMKLIVDNQIALCEFRDVEPEALAEGHARILPGDYLARAINLLGQRTVRRMMFQNDINEEFLDKVFSTVETCENVTIYSEVPDDSQRRILEHYRIGTKQICLYSIPPEELRNQICVQNLDWLNIRNEWVKLDHLVMTNASSLGIYNLDPKILNRFLKLWIRQATSPRLEYLCTDVLGVDFSQFLAGIPHKKMPEESIRVFRHSKKAIECDDWLRLTDTMAIQGGYDFRRIDGVRGTISMRPRNGWWRLEFFVWY